MQIIVKTQTRDSMTLTFDLLTSKSIGVIYYLRPIHMWSLKTIGQCVLKLLVGNHFCDVDDDDDDTDDTDDADDDDDDGQSNPYVSAMLRRRYKKDIY